MVVLSDQRSQRNCD